MQVKYYRISFWEEKCKEKQQEEKKINRNTKKKAAERQIPLNSEYFWFSILPSAAAVAVPNFQVLNYVFLMECVGTTSSYTGHMRSATEQGAAVGHLKGCVIQSKVTAILYSLEIKGTN